MRISDNRNLGSNDLGSYDDAAPQRSESSEGPADLPLVSVIIPMRNEERHVASCLDSVLANDYPHDRLEIICVDGMSEDSTREIVQRYSTENLCVKLLENPRKTYPAAINTAIRSARGQVIVILGAHAEYPKSYISKCVSYLQKFNADSVGAVINSKPRVDTLTAKVIALAVSHSFGAGNAHSRIGTTRPRWVDTIFGGCYRRDVFSRIGLFDPRLARGSDIDLNARLRRAGGRILLAPDIFVDYYPSGTLTALWKREFIAGFGVVYASRLGRRNFRWRHMVPLASLSILLLVLVASVMWPDLLWLLAVIVGIYGLANLAASIHICLRENSFSYLPVLPFAFAIRHLSQALGALYGVLNLVKSRQFWFHLMTNGKRSVVTTENEGLD